MSDGISVEIINLSAFEAAMAGGPAILVSELQTAGRVIAVRGDALSKVYAPVRTGNLRNSVYNRTSGGSGGVEAIFGASADYAIFVEKGRRPGARMPPSGVLLAAGIPAEAEFVVRRSIGRKGIPPRSFVGRAFNELKGGFVYEQFGAAIGRALKRIWG